MSAKNKPTCVLLKVERDESVLFVRVAEIMKSSVQIKFGVRATYLLDLSHHDLNVSSIE